MSRQGAHKKLNSYIDDEDIRSRCLSWLRMQKPSQRTGKNYMDMVNIELLPEQVSISKAAACAWLNQLCFDVTYTDKKKGYIYVDEHERADVVDYRRRFYERWFDKYLSRMPHFEGEDMILVKPELKDGEQRIVSVFYDESTFRANDDQRLCRLEQNEQVLKLKSAGRGLIVFECV